LGVVASYTNILPYDATRVMLPPSPSGATSGYINANWCNGVARRNTYIATQGPVPDSFAEFWWMIWTLKVRPSGPVFALNARFTRERMPRAIHVGGGLCTVFRPPS
jgi:protein tyrosine phosphatase